MPDELRSPGWEAIDAALKPLYPDVRPLHYGTALSYAMGGPDPIDGISVYARRTPDHWHFVTYGFTELHVKETRNPAISGFGFELTIRVARPAGEEKPPSWTLNLLQNLARYVFETGNAFGAGHHMPLNGPICLGSPTAIWAVTFAPDPELKEFRSEFGRAVFLQIVGVTMDELELVKDWNAESFHRSLSELNPLLLTDLARASILADPARSSALRARADAEGSSMVSTYAQKILFRPGPPVECEIGALWIDSVRRGVKGRLLHGRPFDLIGENSVLKLVPGDRAGLKLRENELSLIVPPSLAKEILSTLQPRRGEYRFPSLPGFVLKVAPTEIKDQQGQVGDVVG